MNFEQWKNRKPVKEILGDKTISDDVKFHIIEVLSNRNVSNDRIKNLAYWVKYDVDDNYLNRFDKLLDHPKNDSSSKEIFILRYGEIEGLRRFEEKNLSCTHTEELMIHRYGEKKGKQQWQQYKNNISFANSEEGYIKKYGEDEGVKRFRKQCENNAGNLTLERKQELYGDEIGLEEYNKMKVTLRERHSLENYIRLYGEEEGTQKYLKICEIRSYKNSLSYYIEKYGEEEGTRRIREVKNNGIHMNNHSKISLLLFDALSEYSTSYGSNEEVISLTEDEYSQCGMWNIKPDFLFGKKIIEFYGDRFHGNPELFADEDCCHPFNSSLTAMDMKNRDEKRNNILTERGYSVKIVWENDFRKNADRIIDECKDFLTS